MSWFVDNATTLYILLGIIAAGCVVAWRLNQRVKFLGYAAIAVVLIGGVWLLAHFGTSDNKQLETNVRAMADAVQAGDVDELFKHVSKDFRWKGIDRDLMYAGVKRQITAQKITHVGISSFRVENSSRADQYAKTSFLVSANAVGDQIMFRVEGDFRLESEQWKLTTLRFYRAIGGQDQEIDLPGLR